MSSPLKRFFKLHSRNLLLKSFSRLGLAINRLYENRNYDIETNGELNVLQKLGHLDLSCAVDVGANGGNYLNHLLTQFPGCQAFAFEPEPSAFQTLQDRFGEKPEVTCINQGLWSQDMTRKFYRYQESEHTSSHVLTGMDREILQEFEVETLAGDTFMDKYAVEYIDFLKIDVEGGDLEVLIGFSQALQEGRIRVCQFEYGYANISSRSLLLDFYQFLEPLDYRIGKIYPNGVDFRAYHVKQEDFLGPNYLAVHAAEEELIKLLSQ